MSIDKNKNINELISLIERNKYSLGGGMGGRSRSAADDGDDDDDDDEEDSEPDIEDVRLLIFAAEGPFVDSLVPMLNQHELECVVTDQPDKAIDIAMNNPHIRHVLLDLDRPTNPAKAMNVFADMRTLNPGIVIYYTTKNPMSMESRNLQNKGAKLLQKPVLRKSVDQFYADNFQH